jgi:hypothetical protein
MLLMRSLTSPISSTDAERLSTASVIAFASLVAWRNCRRICDAGCDMFDRLGDFLGGRRDYSDIRCRLFRRCRGGEGLFLIARGAGRHVTRGTVHGNCRPIEGFGDVGYRPLEFPGGGFDELPAVRVCSPSLRRVVASAAVSWRKNTTARPISAISSPLELKPTHTQAQNTVHPPWRHGGCGEQPQGVKPRAAGDPLGGHSVVDQADDRRNDRTGGAAGELADEHRYRLNCRPDERWNYCRQDLRQLHRRSKLRSFDRRPHCCRLRAAI